MDKERVKNSAIVGALYSGVCVPQIYRTIDKFGSAMVRGAQQGKRATLLKAVLTTAILCSLGNGSNMGQIGALINLRLPHVFEPPHPLPSPICRALGPSCSFALLSSESPHT